MSARPSRSQGFAKHPLAVDARLLRITLSDSASALAVAMSLVAGASPGSNDQPPSGRRYVSVSGTTLRGPNGNLFLWRGLSAFRLLEMVAHGRRAEAVALLDWAASQHVTVVRTLSMAKHLFDLAPADGVRALPVLLDVAQARGLHVEIVALADTAEIRLDTDAHVRAIGAVAARYADAIVEIANEPIHPTQRLELHDPALASRLAALIPDAVPVSWGSAEGNEGFSGGDYATFHFPRESGAGGWGHVVALARGGELIARWRKPVVNDEPIGAAQVFTPGRRDNDPARFRAGALITRLSGMGGTFHYEGGLQAKAPSGRELECFNAWNEAWTLLPADIETAGTFRASGTPGAAVSGFSRDRALAVFERQRGSDVWVVMLDVKGDPALRWASGWTAGDVKTADRVRIVSATR